MIRRSLPCMMLLAAWSAGAAAEEEPPRTPGQTLYLPVYSHLYHGDLDKTGKPQETLVSTHVSLRNTDPRQPVKIVSARYHDTQGRLVWEYIATPQTIAPLGTHELYVPRTDVSGGSGASFLITWTADVPVNPLLVEALHADIREARTLIFLTTAHPVRTR